MGLAAAIALSVSSLATAASDMSWANGAGSYKPSVTIVNKAKLPPDRLAEAIAAKAFVTDNRSLLRSATDACPNDAKYWYMTARGQLPSWFVSDGDISAPSVTVALARGRALLERSLKCDPHYLPALYAYATSEPMHDQRIKALRSLAALDSDNAEPCYLLAIEEFRDITRGRKITEVSDHEAFQMSQSEWQTVSDLIEQGNNRPCFEWRTAATPNTTDLVISVHGKKWPAAAVKSYAELYSTICGGSADAALDPHGMCTGSIWRQLARQANWAAKEASKNGDNAKALHYTSVMMNLGYRYAACKPERMMPLLMGRAIWGISKSGAVDTLAKTKDDAGLRKLEAEEKAWKDAIGQCMPLMKSYTVTVRSIKISPTEYLTYNDSAIEEAGVKEILAGLPTRN